MLRREYNNSHVTKPLVQTKGVGLVVTLAGTQQPTHYHPNPTKTNPPNLNSQSGAQLKPWRCLQTSADITVHSERLTCLLTSLLPITDTLGGEKAPNDSFLVSTNYITNVLAVQAVQERGSKSSGRLHFYQCLRYIDGSPANLALAHWSGLSSSVSFSKILQIAPSLSSNQIPTLAILETKAL